MKIIEINESISLTINKLPTIQGGQTYIGLYDSKKDTGASAWVTPETAEVIIKALSEVKK